MVINHNMSAMNAQRQLGVNTGAQSKSIEKLSSGLRINRAGDDAAGLAISEKMRGQIRGLDQASRNSQDGISLLQTAEGAVNETHSILQRMRELSVQSSNGTYTSTDRAAIQKEFNQLRSEVTRIGQQTEFNTQKLLNAGKTISFQVGANSGQTISIDLKSMGATGLNITGATVSTQAGAQSAITTIQKAIEDVSSFRADLGSVQNRLEHTIAADDNTSENIQAAESRVRDVDMAKEMMSYSKSKILASAAQSMLAQANQAPQNVLQLLQ
ncbi:flagellin [Inconstantimicrobium mannanitabidum]|uniref:Flagellin n=2 Tax=Inconstantimicrobium mannanitabidum TaxID=1604901 RepID=A0ACB5R8F3_9CLOT|nr:flagellin [Clostridium sp. TW13]GKX65468.1 flagellin [Clostridium sp. TW13]GKX65469.1 flagellin [Clostridium sp. TW13]